jgi:hypothetical protein
MRYRIDAQHYIHNRLLEPGHIIGDNTDVPFREADGTPMVPSASMTPLNEEAMGLFKKKFPGAKLPPKSALDAIPLHNQGPVQTGGPGDWVIGPDGQVTNQLKKGLPDSNTPNTPVGQPVVGVQSAPGTTPQHPVQPPQDQGQPPGAPLKQPQSAPSNQPQPPKKA